MTLRSALVLALLIGVPGGDDQEQISWISPPPGAACGTWRERVTTTLRSQLGVRDRLEEVRREGVLQVRTSPDTGGALLEAWYDSLALRRSSPEGTLIPETDGFLGGRYGGVLTAEGRYRRSEVPFVPGPVSEVTDLQGTLDDFFPRLPSRSLAVGELDRQEDMALERLSDSAGLARLRWSRTGGPDTVVADSGQVRAIQEVREIGALTWHRTTGPVGWTRSLTIDADVRGGTAIGRIRTRAEQEIAVSRVAGCEGRR